MKVFRLFGGVTRVSTLFLATAIVTNVPVFAKAVMTSTFDDLPSNTAIPNGYRDLVWNNFSVIDRRGQVPGGYHNGVVSGDDVASNVNGEKASIKAQNSRFAIKSGWFGAAWNDGLTIHVTGQVNGLDAYSRDIVVNTSGPVYQDFSGWKNLSGLTFDSFGGTNAGYGGSGPQFTMDNVSLHASRMFDMKLPIAAAFLGLGAVLIGTGDDQATPQCSSCGIPSVGAPEIDGGKLPLAVLLLVLGVAALDRRRRGARDPGSGNGAIAQ